MKKNVLMITLGCDKNTVDSEKMLGLLGGDSNWNIVNDPNEADIIIINTCGFIEAAKQESVNSILSAINLKKTKPELKVIAVGCMVERYLKELSNAIPEVDGFLGSNSEDKLINILNELENEKEEAIVNKSNNINDDGTKRIITNKNYTYLKVSEGCNKKCTYCAIPIMRGKYKSREINAIIKEANYIAEHDIKEISLIAQDVTSYGIDLYKEYCLPQVLNKLVEIKDIHWFRLLYCYPDHITDELLNIIKENNNICNYLDIPLQHAHPYILQKMGRNNKPEYIIDLIAKIRKIIPDIALRTTFIVGFPGETEEHFQYLLDFIKKIKFDWVGAFKYSQEEGTKAALLPNQISEEIKQERFEEIMLLQKQITNEKNHSLIGRNIEVFIEGEAIDFAEGYYIGRSQYQAADIDGVVYVKGNNLSEGSFVNVEIRTVDEYDLIGDVI